MPAQAWEELTVVAVRGVDARTFLQGQLTSDVRKVSEQTAAWGALCTGQGRVQALVTLSALPGGGFFALLPRLLADGLLERLCAFTLSSKVTFERLPWVAAPVTETEARALVGDLPSEPFGCRMAPEGTLLRWWGTPARYLYVGPRERLPTLTEAALAARFREFRKLDVEAGMPAVFRETQGLFVPQTLNLDLLGAVSFDKGCYVGQEVVARARRGGVPRRLFGFSAPCAPPLPGAVVSAGDQEVGAVVDSVASDRGCDLLVVVDLESANRALVLGDGAPLVLRSLPYAVPLERR